MDGPKITFTPEYRDISYNITIKASNLEYNIESTLQNALRINIIEDKKSGEYKLSHHIDLKSGYYNGKKILDI